MKPVVSVLAVTMAASAAFAQEPGPTPGPAASRVIGEVTSVDAAARRISLRPDTGPPVTVVLNDKTLFLRVPPGEKDLKKATRIALGDIAPGDRVYARGPKSDDGQSVTAGAVIVMTKADLAKKHQADREEWQRRGSAGVVTAIDPASKRLTISTGSKESAQTATVATAAASFRRYAPDSIRFSDAKPSSFEEIAVGDYLRVLGDKNSDGTRIDAQEIVFGSFHNLAARVKSVDLSANEIRATDLETKKPVTIRITVDSMLRRMPPMLAQMMAQRRAGGGSGWQRPGAPNEQGGPAGTAGPPRGAGQWSPGAGGGQAAAAGSPNGPAAAGQWGPPGNAARGGRPDFQQMLERLPALTLSELKPGDAIVLSAASGANPSAVTAIALLAGVEPLLASGATDPQLGGMWSFDVPVQ